MDFIRQLSFRQNIETHDKKKLRPIRIYFCPNLATAQRALWFFAKKWQERAFKLTISGQLTYALQLVKQSYELAK
jgi:hypothetical protein